jgi:hypothetical protein
LGQIFFQTVEVIENLGVAPWRQRRHDIQILAGIQPKPVDFRAFVQGRIVLIWLTFAGGRDCDPTLNCPSVPVDQFQLGQAQQIAGMVDPFGGALAGELVVLSQEGRQPECLQVMGG